MAQLVTIKQASTLVGLSTYALRKGVISGRFPSIRTSERGKIYIDLHLLAQALATEAWDLTKQSE